MGSSQNNGGGWVLDYGLAVDEVSAGDFLWAPQIIDDPMVSSTIIEFATSCKVGNSYDNAHSKKRTRVESCAEPGTKACREKMRRDRLNERFTELCSILSPGKPPNGDKVAILSDATRLLNQLRTEAQKLKQSNEALQDAIKNLKAEKSELRDEKIRLKAEKERMEQMLKGMSITPPLIPHPAAAAAAAAAYHAAALTTCHKNISYPNYLPMGMWQWIPPAALDISQDHMLRSPVA